MDLEPYSIRADFSRFGDEINTCKEALEIVSSTKKFDKKTYETINLIITGLEYLAKMCQKQGIHLLGFGENKAQPFRDTSAALNQMLTLRSLYMEDSTSEHIQGQRNLTINLLDKLYNAILSKVSRIALEAVEDTEKQEELKNERLTTLNRLKELNAPEEIISQYTDLIDSKPQTQDQLDYESLNLKLASEKENLDNLLEEGELLSGFIGFQGSVAVNHFFKARDLKGIDYSMFSFKGVEFSFNRRETIPPMFVFHDQVLIAFDLKKRRFKFGRKEEDYKSPQMIMEEKKNEILNHSRYRNFINLTQYVESGYLYSKAYKGLYFLWLAKPEVFNALGRFPENRTALLWESK